jgi:hypothetical protein
MACPLFRRSYPDTHSLTLDLLTGADLGRFPALGKTINCHRTGGDKLLAEPAAIGDTCQFQQITKTHMVITQPEFTGFQGQFAALLETPMILEGREGNHAEGPCSNHARQPQSFTMR